MIKIGNRGIRSPKVRDRAKRIIISILETSGKLSVKEMLELIKKDNLKPSPRFTWESRRIGAFLRMLRKEGLVEKQKGKWMIIKTKEDILYCRHGCGVKLVRKYTGAYTCPLCKCVFRVALVRWTPNCFRKHHPNYGKVSVKEMRRKKRRKKHGE